MKSDVFDEGVVMHQLESAGIWAFFNLMRKGYPYHLGIINLHEKHLRHLMASGLNLEPKKFCDLLLRSVGMRKTDYKIGTTKVMIRSGNSVLIDRLNDFSESAVKLKILMIKRKLIALSKWRVISTAILFHVHCKPNSQYPPMKNNNLLMKFFDSVCKLLRASRMIRKSSVNNPKLAENADELGNKDLNQSELSNSENSAEFKGSCPQNDNVVQEEHGAMHIRSSKSKKTENKAKRPKLPADTRYDQMSHFPYHDEFSSASRCKFEKCKQKTHVQCRKCDVHLCFTRGRNCFSEFHHPSTE